MLLKMSDDLSDLRHYLGITPKNGDVDKYPGLVRDRKWMITIQIWKTAKLIVRDMIRLRMK